MVFKKDHSIGLLDSQHKLMKNAILIQMFFNVINYWVTMLSNLLMSTYLFLIENLCRKIGYYLHLTDEEIS